MKTIAIVMLIAGFVLFAGCKKNAVPPSCSETGKLESANGFSLMSHPFIRTSDNKLLFVCKSSVSFQWNTAYTGMPVNFSYEMIPDTALECALAQIDLHASEPYIPVKLTCISATEK